METIKVQWTGMRPVLMTNPQMVKISNPFAVEGRRLNDAIKKARKAQDNDKLIELEQAQIRNDWESSAYWDDAEKKFFIPDTLLLACIRSGATAVKKGKDVDRAVLVSETQAYVETIATPSMEAAFENPAFRMECPCKIPPKTGNLIWKCRCMIPTGWKLTFGLEFDTDIFAEKTLVTALEAAGRNGIGSWRPKFGRFTSEIL